jgi:hypothetical protein
MVRTILFFVNSHYENNFVNSHHPILCQKSVSQRRSEYHIIESVQYYFNNIDVIKQPNYISSENDIVHSRIRTFGIVTEKYVIDNTPFEMYDCGWSEE